MDKSDIIYNRFPQNAYNPDNKQSSLYKLIRAIASELNATFADVDRINNMISVDTTLPDDLYNRWGALLGIKRNENEADEQYRNRLKTSVTALSGGTTDAIKYAVACGLGINNDPIAMDRIHVYDAWEYTGAAEVLKDYGYIVCEVDLNQELYSTDVEDIVLESANNVKAAGVVIQFVYYNFRILYYTELDEVSYASLSTLTYSQVGE